jgi:hypothetical protein
MCRGINKGNGDQCGREYWLDRNGYCRDHWDQCNSLYYIKPICDNTTPTEKKIKLNLPTNNSIGSSSLVNNNSIGSSSLVNNNSIGSSSLVNNNSIGSSSLVNNNSIGSSLSVKDNSIGSNPQINNNSFESSSSVNNNSIGSSPSVNKNSFGSTPSLNNYTFGSTPSFNNYTFGSNLPLNNYSFGSMIVSNNKILGYNSTMDKDSNILENSFNDSILPKRIGLSSNDNIRKRDISEIKDSNNLFKEKTLLDGIKDFNDFIELKFGQFYALIYNNINRGIERKRKRKRKDTVSYPNKFQIYV